MKKRIIFLLQIIFLSSFLCHARKQYHTDWQKLGFKGKVEFYSIYYYRMDGNGDIKKEHNLRDRYYCARFNEDGWMISEQDHIWPGMYNTAWIFTYYSYEFNNNDKKWPSKRVIIRSDTVKSVNNYDDKGNLLEISNLNSDSFKGSKSQNRIIFHE